MAVTILHACVREVLERSGDGRQSATTSASGATNTLVDAGLADSYNPTTEHEDAWVKLIQGPLADEVRRVGDYDRNTGTLTVGRDYATQPASGMAYQISTKLPFADVVNCVNWALGQGYFTQLHVQTPTLGQHQYDCPTWITARGQVISWKRRTGDTADKYRYHEDIHLRWVETAGATPGQTDTVLKFEVDPPVPTDQAIVLEAIRPYPALTSGSAGTSMDLEWLTRGALYRYYELLAARAGKADAQRYEKMAGQWRAKWLGACARHQPLRPSVMAFDAPFVATY